MKTTTDKLKLTAPELSKYDNELLELWIDDAYIDVQHARFPKEVEERANRYLAAYYGHLSERSSDKVQVKKLSSLQLTYFSPSDLKDPYLVEYKRLLEDYTDYSSSHVDFY